MVHVIWEHEADKIRLASIADPASNPPLTLGPNAVDVPPEMVAPSDGPNRRE
jgi:hypothetical protein